MSNFIFKMLKMNRVYSGPAIKGLTAIMWAHIKSTQCHKELYCHSQTRGSKGLLFKYKVNRFARKYIHKMLITSPVLLTFGGCWRWYAKIKKHWVKAVCLLNTLLPVYAHIQLILHWFHHFTFPLHTFTMLWWGAKTNQCSDYSYLTTCNCFLLNILWTWEYITRMVLGWNVFSGGFLNPHFRIGMTIPLTAQIVQEGLQIKTWPDQTLLHYCITIIITK